MGWPADVAASAHVFVESAAELVDGLDVTGEDGHHLARVLRLRAGETVTVADGLGTWRPYAVGEVTATGVRLEGAGQPAREPVLEPRLAVAFALTKGEKPELVVQKLTELGVDRILPVVGERSVARPEQARAAAMVERWRRIAREAARQSRRARLPIVEELGPLSALAGHPAIVVADRGGETVEALGEAPGGEVLLVVGPEGGLTPDETEGLKPWAGLALGPYVLRAETATIAVAALLASRRRPPGAPPASLAEGSRAENPR